MPDHKKLRQVQEDFATTLLQQIYQEALREDKRLSLISLISACLAFLFFLGGGVLGYIGYTPIGIISSLSSSIPTVFTAIFIKQQGDSKKYLDKIRLELLDEQKALRSERIDKETWSQISTIIQNISDEEQKNQIIRVMILQKLGRAKDQEVITRAIPNLGSEGTSSTSS